ncbi:WxL domain-containing protein [Vagococcus sp. CY52-2]|uniref:WxL domain-containing protein n=1 Tax=Vagococcus sp. CY52-2 TaxID=2925838 RepID=UPI001F58A1B3|nr:WxL domain-containing protein [Vagococcus sp. CY52-2]UNM89472.1 WxL domain-containing protein [Vagococcus sp. CY52-2]
MKKMLGTLLISSTVLVSGLQTYAVTVEENGQINSEATITVNPGAKEPTKPENPDTPSGETGQSGPLSIDNVIVFNFKDMNLSGRTQKISLKNDGAESIAKRNIQVTDTRGTGAGWNLQIKQSELTDSTTNPGTTNTLRGAYITLNNGSVVAGSDNAVAQDDAGITPTLNEYAPNAENKNSFQKIITAEKGQGMGTFKVFYNKDATGLEKDVADDIQLVVPSGNMVGTYQGTVTWALSDSPSASPVK